MVKKKVERVVLGGDPAPMLALGFLCRVMQFYFGSNEAQDKFNGEPTFGDNSMACGRRSRCGLVGRIQHPHVGMVRRLTVWSSVLRRRFITVDVSYLRRLSETWSEKCPRVISGAGL